jgi:hypothetical protein
MRESEYTMSSHVVISDGHIAHIWGYEGVLGFLKFEAITEYIIGLIQRIVIIGTFSMYT